MKYLFKAKKKVPVTEKVYSILQAQLNKLTKKTKPKYKNTVAGTRG